MEHSLFLLFAQTTTGPVPTNSDPGSLLIYFIGACAAMVIGIIGSLVSGRVVPTATLNIVQKHADEQKARADRFETALLEANRENRELSAQQAKSQTLQAESQAILAKSLDRFSLIIEERPRNE